MTATCPRCADITWHDGELQRQAARAVEAERQRDAASEEARIVTAIVSELRTVLGVPYLGNILLHARRVLSDHDEARQSLRERTAEREALCELVSVLEEREAALLAALRQCEIMSGYTEADKTIPRICAEARKAGEHG